MKLVRTPPSSTRKTLASLAGGCLLSLGALQFATAASGDAHVDHAPVKERPIISQNYPVETLFAFDSAVLTEDGKVALDRMLQELGDRRIEAMVAIGHADRIGDESYNRSLSEQRADAVRDYLQTARVVPAHKVYAVGVGDQSPQASDCQQLGPDDGSNAELVACLAPDRRVTVEVIGAARAD